MTVPGNRLEELRRRRPDLHRIIELVEPGWEVLDLGCGNGELLSLLRELKNVRGQGVDRSQERIMDCVARGLPVCQLDLDEGLADYGDRSYDAVILSQTLQVVHRPLVVLREMVRVGRVGILSLVNFGHLSIRLRLLVSGGMPRTRTLPHAWYETPNIHLSTLKDFRKLCHDDGIRIVQEIPMSPGSPRWLAGIWPNGMAALVVCVVARAEGVRSAGG
jgi:methionine biosynthesis protein MetW